MNFLDNFVCQTNNTQTDSNVTRAWDGVWWSLVTMTTVGYGDKHPCSVPAKLLAMLWMVLAVVFVSVMNATVTNSVIGTDDMGLEG